MSIKRCKIIFDFSVDRVTLACYNDDTKLNITKTNGDYMTKAKHTDYDNANAHLIAAAPDMLEALENLIEFVRSGSGDFGMKAHFIKEAEKALDKAEGK